MLAALWVAGAARAAEPAPARRGDPTALEPLALARMYAAGRRAEAVAALAGWREEDLKREWFAVKALMAQGGGHWPVPALRAAILLHSDRAGVQRLQSLTAAPGVACGIGKHDGHARSLAILLLTHSEASRDSSRGREFVRRWLRAMALDSHRHLCLDDVLEWAREGLKWFPQDAPLLLARATAVEASLVLNPLPDFQRASSIERTARLDKSARRRQQFEDAVRDLELALVIDPELDDARLRLGRLLWRLEKPEEARAALGPLLRRECAPPIRYLGHLFLGRVLEDVGEAAAAIAHYRSALEIDPAAQAAAIALSQALVQGGDPSAARDVLRHALQQAPRQEPRDAFLSYPFGRAAEAEVLLDALRAETLE